MWGEGIAKAMTFFIIMCCLISAVVGWMGRHRGFDLDFQPHLN